MKTPYLPTSGRDLIIMVGSDSKLPGTERAIELYQGPLFRTYRANVRYEACPHVLVLTSRTGFEPASDIVLSRYEERLDAERMALMMQDVRKYLASCRTIMLGAVTNVLLVGSKEYHPLMQAAVEYFRSIGKLKPTVTVKATTGRMGQQCQQLAAYLRELTPYAKIVDHAPNGSPLYDSLGGYTVGQLISIEDGWGRREPGPRQGTILELTMNADGPIAQLKFLNAGKHYPYQPVGLGQLRPEVPENVRSPAMVGRVEPAPCPEGPLGVTWAELVQRRQPARGHAPDLVILACSGRKHQEPSPALDLYKGVLYGTFRANVKPDARPQVAILSALHGFISGDAVIAPYEKRLTTGLAEKMVANLGSYLQDARPLAAKNVLLAGSNVYRQVMRAAIPLLIAVGCIAPDAKITETTGGIGYQRQRLGEFLRALPAPDLPTA